MQFCTGSLKLRESRYLNCPTPWLVFQRQERVIRLIQCLEGGWLCLRATASNRLQLRVAMALIVLSVLIAASWGMTLLVLTGKWLPLVEAFLVIFLCTLGGLVLMWTTRYSPPPLALWLLLGSPSAVFVVLALFNR